MSSAQTCPRSRVIQKRPVDRPTFLRDCGLQVLSTDSTADSRNKLLYMNKKNDLGKLHYLFSHKFN